MRRAYWSLIAAAILMGMMASACGTRTPAEAPTAAASSPTQNTVPGVVSASVEVRPADTSDLGFLIAAPVRQINVKEGEAVKAGQVLMVLDTPDLDSAVSAAQGELHSAMANQSVQREGRQTRIQRGHKLIWLGSMPEIRLQADARVQQAQAALEAAQANLAQGSLVAPYDGTVVSIAVNAGEMVQASQPVITLANLGHLQIVTTDLSEREIANIRIGQTAATRLKAFDQEIAGKVVAISPLSNVNNGDTVFRVTIEPDNAPQGMLWGMTGDAAIQTK